MADARLQVRLRSPWTDRVETELAVFSRDIPAERADALLCEWAPDDELFSFPRRKAWYCCEPACQFRGLGNGTWPKLRSRLGPHEFLWHGHPDPRYGVPHVTHFQPLEMNRNSDRLQKAVAIVSNHGGSPWTCHPDIRYRNRLITLPQVDLYGRKSWQRYRRNWFSLPRAPRNYRGELPGDWPGEEKRRLMSRYKVCVCLENMNEPGYFTEKFLEAVVAGCIPVYRASADIRDTVLQGASWVDPGASGWPDEQALQAAVNADLTACQAQNQAWLATSRHLAATHASAIFDRISTILAGDHRSASGGAGQ
jgi:hypothetical protein